MENFCGSYEHQLDGKNRIRIPAKYRAKLGKNYSFMMLSSDCIGVYSGEALDAILEKLNAVTSGDPRKMMAKRRILSTVQEANEDDQGRIVLSAMLRKEANIQKDVITIGMGNHLEIWAKEVFEKYNAEMTLAEAGEILDI